MEHQHFLFNFCIEKEVQNVTYLEYEDHDEMLKHYEDETLGGGALNTGGVTNTRGK